MRIDRRPDRTPTFRGQAVDFTTMTPSAKHSAHFRASGSESDRGFRETPTKRVTEFFLRRSCGSGGFFETINGLIRVTHFYSYKLRGETRESWILRHIAGHESRLVPFSRSEPLKQAGGSPSFLGHAAAAPHRHGF